MGKYDDYDPTSIAQGFGRRAAEFEGFPVGPIAPAPKKTIKEKIDEGPGPARDADRPSRHGKLLGEALELISALGRRDAPMPIPDCCATCAFRLGSMPNMTAGTGKMALDCVLGIDKDRFACHHGMREGEPKKLCTGYIAALIAPFAEVKAVLEAFYDELSDLPEDVPDDVRINFDAWLDEADPERRWDIYQAARAYAWRVRNGP